MSAPLSSSEGRPSSAGVFDRLSRPKRAVSKSRLAAKSGCAELTGMLLTDTALQDSLAHLNGQRAARGRSAAGGKPGVRTGGGEGAKEERDKGRGKKPGTAQAKLLESPTGTPLKTERAGTAERPQTTGAQSTTLTEGSGSVVRFDLGAAGMEGEEEIGEAMKDHAMFERKMQANQQRWDEEGQGLYNNPLSIYE